MKNLTRKTLKTFGILLLLTVSLALFSGNASAAIITVCSSGCDYTTINDAIDNAANYGIVKVSAGTYTENIDFDGLDITVMSVAGPDNTIINNGDSTWQSTCSDLNGPGTGHGGIAVRNLQDAVISSTLIVSADPARVNSSIRMDTTPGKTVMVSADPDRVS